MNIEVSLSPALYAARTLTAHHTTVAIDLLRATTAICAAFQAGCQAIVPLDTLEGIGRYRKMGYALAAERNGSKVDVPMDDGTGASAPADYGNSPTEYLRHDMRGLRLAYSTTNGTISLLRAADAELALAGCFANLTALTERLRRDRRDTVLLCSGWKNDFCIEDTLVAGAIVSRLADVATPHGDAAHMALALWEAAKDDPLRYCSQASHVHRLERLGAHEDIVFAFKQDTCPVVPVLKEGTLTL